MEGECLENTQRSLTFHIFTYLDNFFFTIPALAVGMKILHWAFLNHITIRRKQVNKILDRGGGRVQG